MTVWFRFGTALLDVAGGVLHLKSSDFKFDFSPIDPDCDCMVCKNYTRAYLYTLAGRESLGAQLITYHNIAYLNNLLFINIIYV